MIFSYYRVRGGICDGLRGMGWIRRSYYQRSRFEEKSNIYLENVVARQSGTINNKRTPENHVK